jgi:archaellum component FlaF (FlaF/FlaG flagellin family)
MKKSTKNYVRKHIVFKVPSGKNRRGLSTVITTAILLSAISIMGVTLVAWSNTSLQTQQIQMEISFNDKINKLNEDVSIENIWFGTSPNIVNVTLNNVGTIGLNVTAIKIVNTTDTLIEYYTDGGVATGDDFSREIPFNWNAGETTDFTITTNRGNYFYDQEVT